MILYLKYSDITMGRERERERERESVGKYVVAVAKLSLSMRIGRIPITRFILSR